MFWRFGDQKVLIILARGDIWTNMNVGTGIGEFHFVNTYMIGVELQNTEVMTLIKYSVG